MTTPILVGHVAELWRYPVKSMQGESLQEGHIYWHGLDGDRRYAFVQSGNTTSFPWLTGRQIPQLVKYAPRYTTENVISGPLEVTTPAGMQYGIKDVNLKDELAATFGKPIHLMHLNRGAYDDTSLSLISNGTLNDVNGLFGTSLDKRRFRQNIVIDTVNRTSYLEEEWLGRTLIFGNREDSPRIALIQRIPRCQMINIDPNTAEKDARVLRGITSNRDQCLGVHAWPTKIGRIYTGDEIFLI